jgi:hypothetical protein
MVKLCAYITLLQRSRIQMCIIHMFRAAINIALLGMQIDRPHCAAAAMSMNIYNLQAQLILTPRVAFYFAHKLLKL